MRWFPPACSNIPSSPRLTCSPRSHSGTCPELWAAIEQAADSRAAEGRCVVWGWTESGVGELRGRCTSSHSDCGSVRAQPHPQGSMQPPTAPASSLCARGLAGAARLSPLRLHTFVNTQGAPPCAGLCLRPRTPRCSPQMGPVLSALSVRRGDWCSHLVLQLWPEGFDLLLEKFQAGSRL